MTISKSKLKSYIEVIAKVSQDAVDTYDNLAKMIELSTETDRVWDEYSIGESNGCTSVLKLALVKVSERISRLKVILDTLLCAYEDYMYMDEKPTKSKDCDEDCLTCTKRYSVYYLNLDEDFDDDEDEDGDDEDDDASFKLDIDDDVSELEFDAIVASIRESLYGTKKGNKSPKDESVKTKINSEKCGSNKSGKSKDKSECSEEKEGVRSSEPATKPSVKKKTKGKA